MNRLVVSTECPTCAAPLDFSEGSNAVQCLHCRCQLLVTGRKRVLSYYVAPKLDARGAAVKVMFAQQETGQRCRISKADLYFIPYYRLTGHDLRWEKPETLPSPPPPDLDEGQLFRLGRALSGQRRVFGETEEDSELALHDRYLERSFVACQLAEPNLYSLGIRPSVLRLLLFHGATVRGVGKVVAAELSPETALARGMKVVQAQPIFQRRVIGRLLSLIYFPYWVVEVERGNATLLSLVDAVSEMVAKLDAAPALYEVLNREPGADPSSAGFRPLMCPNCGADLPVRPDDVVFFCLSCESAWHVEGEDLQAVTYQTGPVPDAVDRTAVKYLPFWLLDVEGPQHDQRRLFLPAFRYRRLKVLVDLARSLSQKQPPVGNGELSEPSLVGCHYDRDDAVLLAELTYPGLARVPRRAIAQLEDERLRVQSAVLTWLPFQVRGSELVDCCTGRALAQQLLLLHEPTRTKSVSPRGRRDAESEVQLEFPARRSRHQNGWVEGFLLKRNRVLSASLVRQAFVRSRRGQLRIC